MSRENFYRCDKCRRTVEAQVVKLQEPEALPSGWCGFIVNAFDCTFPSFDLCARCRGMLRNWLESNV